MHVNNISVAIYIYTYNRSHMLGIANYINYTDIYMHMHAYLILYTYSQLYTKINQVSYVFLSYLVMLNYLQKFTWYCNLAEHIKG